MAEPIRIATVPGAATTSGRHSTAAIVRMRQDFFARALARVLAVPVEVTTFPDYLELSGRVALGEAHLAWMPPVAAYRVLTADAAVPLVLPLRMGTAVFTSALFCRPQNAPPDLAGASGFRAAWVDPVSAAGYLVVRAGLRAAGWDPERLFPLQSFHGSHSEVVRAVLSGEADVGATYVHRDAEGAIRRAGWGDASVHVLLEHGPVPSDALIASRQLSPELVNKIRTAFVQRPDMALLAAARELFEAEAFALAEVEHFLVLERYLPFLDEEDRERVSALPPLR
ncbi:MAG: PhnD/SsuA/transferrin family substrate-binding protein [Polyangiaceae bacterium]